jgi:hypothetical protein
MDGTPTQDLLVAPHRASLIGELLVDCESNMTDRAILHVQPVATLAMELPLPQLFLSKHGNMVGATKVGADDGLDAEQWAGTHPLKDQYWVGVLL